MNFVSCIGAKQYNWKNQCECICIIYSLLFSLLSDINFNFSNLCLYFYAFFKKILFINFV